MFVRYSAQLLFHEPHARMNNPADVSGNRVLRAARSILELMYAIAPRFWALSTAKV